MNDTPYTAHGDEPVEARIVSWVLGEASPFEVEELQRLCDERPELAIFKRRMEAMHGMLNESAHPVGDADWKLPASKRAPIEALLGARANLEQERRIRHSGRRAFWAIAACFALTLVVARLLKPIFWVPRSLLREPEMSCKMAVGTDSTSRMVPFSEVSDMDVPAELIEGTPKPINVPGLVDSSKDIQGMLKNKSVRSEQAKNEAEQLSMDDRAAGASGSLATYDAEHVQEHATLSESNTYFRQDKMPQSAQDEGEAKKSKQRMLQPGTVPPPAVEAPAVSLKSQSSAEGKKGFGDARGAVAPPKASNAKLRGEDPESRPAAQTVPAPTEELKIAEREKVDDYRNQSSLGVDGLKGKKINAPQAAGAENADEARRRANTPLILGDIPVNGALFKYANAQSELDLYKEKDAQPATHGVLADAKEGGLKRDLSNLIEGSEQVEKPKEIDLLQKSAEKPADQPVADKKVVKEFIELAAADEPYSTFSLNISDASFQVAQAALAKGEQPDPAGINVEQFYNAVDYGDPSPGVGQPVAGTVEQVAHPVIPGRNLVRVAIKTAASGRSAGQPLRLTLLADQSGSMGREDRREAMERALASLANLLTENDTVNVIGFARTPHLLADGLNGKDAGQLKGMINQEASEGGTNLEEAIKLAEQLAKRHQQEGAQNRIVLFTDGAANLGDADPESLANKVKQLRQDGIAFDIAGIAADGLNDELLGELARNGNGRYYVMGKGEGGDFAKQLAGAFRPAAENVKVQVHFNPERVGRYKLVGFEKDRLKKEDFRNDAVDAAEMAAEEAGVAIYQVEPLADGNGELGEVSVRFRDTASGQMVERTWAIPYDTSVPTLDHSVPSMQLATLAMLAGEKLKGGPLADAIDFKQFVNVMANVKQHYGPSGRVGEVLQMVNTLK